MLEKLGEYTLRRSGGLWSPRYLEGYYPEQVCCNNCGNFFPIWIKKGTTKPDAVKDIPCDVCGCIGFGIAVNYP